MTNAWVRYGLRWTRILLVIYLLILLALMWFEGSLVFFPTRGPIDRASRPRPPCEDVDFAAADGVRLHGWYLPHEAPRGWVLFIHGNAGNIANRSDIVEQLRRRYRWSVFVFDYRGYGQSEGSPTEAGILADARSARRWLASKAGVAEHEIILYGESLGGGVAVDLAAADGAAGLILDRTFTALPDVAAAHYPWAPVRWLMRTRLDSLAKIGRYQGPVLIAHGDADEIVPLDQARRLYAAANEPKRLVVLSRVGHNDPHPPQFFRAVDEFFARR